MFIKKNLVGLVIVLAAGYCMVSDIHAEEADEEKKTFLEGYRQLFNNGDSMRIDELNTEWFFSPSIKKEDLSNYAFTGGYSFFTSYLETIAMAIDQQDTGKFKGNITPFALLMPFAHIVYKDLLSISPDYKESSTAAVEAPHIYDIQRRYMSDEEIEIEVKKKRQKNDAYVASVEEKSIKAGVFLFNQYLEQCKNDCSSENLNKLQSQCLLALYMDNQTVMKTMIKELNDLKQSNQSAVQKIDDVINKVQLATFAGKKDRDNKTPLSLTEDKKIKESLIEAVS